MCLALPLSTTLDINFASFLRISNKWLENENGKLHRRRPYSNYTQDAATREKCTQRATFFLFCKEIFNCHRFFKRAKDLRIFFLSLQTSTRWSLVRSALGGVGGGESSVMKNTMQFPSSWGIHIVCGWKNDEHPRSPAEIKIMHSQQTRANSKHHR